MFSFGKVRILTAAMAASGLMGLLSGQQGRPRFSTIQDWSDRQVIFTETNSIWKMLSNQQDPRYWRKAALRRANWSARARAAGTDANISVNSVRDWNLSLGTGSNTMSVGHMPAKFVFDVNQPASCTNDFVVTGTGLAGSSLQATIIGLRNLYSNPGGTGSCPGTGPTILFSYNLNGAVLRHAVVLSLDGTKVAFVDSTGVFHVLRWASGTGNGTSVSSPAVPGTGNTAQDQTVSLAPGTGTSPFIDYANDVAYVTTSNDGRLHKITPVFNGTPAEVTTGGWPITMPVTNISTPVLDFSTKRLFLTGDGTIYMVDTTAANVSVSSTKFSFSGSGSSYPVTIDSTNQRIYAWHPSNGTNAIIAQADTALSTGSRVTVAVGRNASGSPLGGDFNRAYYAGTAASARLYVIGNTGTTNRVPGLYAFSFDSNFKMNATAANGPLALATSTSGLDASYVTSFYNATQNKDYIFFGVTGSCMSGMSTGCVRSVDVTSGFPTSTTINNVILGANGGTYGIAVDNNSSAAEASSVYYVVRGTNQLVKATQAALN